LLVLVAVVGAILALVALGEIQLLLLGLKVLVP
jgi:hypothetical protein